MYIYLPTQLLDLPSPGFDWLPHSRNVSAVIQCSVPKRKFCSQIGDGAANIVSGSGFLKIPWCVRCLDPTCSRSKTRMAFSNLDLQLLTSYFHRFDQRTHMPLIVRPTVPRFGLSRTRKPGGGCAFCWDKPRISHCTWMKQTPCSRAFQSGGIVEL